MGSTLGDSNCGVSGQNARGGVILVAKRHERGFKRNFVRVYRTVGALTRGCPSISFVCPVRLGPGIHGPVGSMFKRRGFVGVFFVRPLRCLSFICLVSGSFLILASDNKVRRRTPKLKGPILIVHSAARHPRTLRTKAIGLINASCCGVIGRMDGLLRDGACCRSVDGTIGPCNSKYTYSHVIALLRRM